MVEIISVVIGDHFGDGDHFDGGDHFGGGTARRLIEFWRKRECHNAREMPLTEVCVT